MKAIIVDNKVVATALDSYPTQGWEQAVLAAPEDLTSENMGRWVYLDGELTYPAEEVAREKRNQLLSECDWVVVKSVELGESVPTIWSDYRQALRDITTHVNWPNLSEEDWPVKP